MPEKIDSVREILYNEKLEQIATLAAEKAVERVVSTLTNLDNETVYKLSLSLKPTLTVDETAKLIGISKPKVYELVKKKKLPAIHVGKKILINHEALYRWAEGEVSYG